MAAVLTYVRLFAPYAVILLAVVAECFAMRRDERIGGTFFAIGAALLYVLGGWLLGSSRGVKVAAVLLILALTPTLSLAEDPAGINLAPFDRLARTAESMANSFDRAVTVAEDTKDRSFAFVERAEVAAKWTGITAAVAVGWFLGTYTFKKNS